MLANKVKVAVIQFVLNATKALYSFHIKCATYLNGNLHTLDESKMKTYLVCCIKVVEQISLNLVQGMIDDKKPNRFTDPN